MDKRQEWLDVVELFRVDINAQVLCPECKASNLIVIDIPFDNRNKSKGGERCLKCLSCGKKKFILYRIPPENWLSKHES
jgi:hypothetical protein